MNLENHINNLWLNLDKNATLYALTQEKLFDFILNQLELEHIISENAGVGTSSNKTNILLIMGG